jgi:pimeloyl-ACP methyl ester carboxylesterase
MDVLINNLKINYEILGKGFPILFLHGWGGSLESLEKLGGLLTKYNYKVYLLDLPGFGKSDNPKKPFSLDDYTKIVETFLKNFNIDEVCIFGHSFGGSVGVKLCIRKIIKVKKLILCNSAGIRKGISGKEERYKRISFIKKTFSLPLLNKVYPMLRKGFYLYILKERDYISYPKLSETFKLIVKEDVTPILKDVNVPTLILWGENDKITPLDHAQIFHKNIKDSKLKVINNIGHSLPKTNPELIIKEVVDFLEA